MAMAEEFINDDPNDRLRENDADAQIEATIFKQGQDYAERNARSKEENAGRAESRAKIKNLGMDTNAYATAIRLIKDKTQAEITAWKRDFELTLKVMGSKQRELFPIEQMKAEARIQKAKDKAAKEPRSGAELDAATDTNPKSDPASGGAQIDLEDVIAAAGGQTIEEREAAEGEAAIAEAAPTLAKKPSQSERAAAKRAAAGMN